MVDVAPSEAFEKNTQLVIDLLDQIPAGRCTTYGALGRCIGIVPRYAALIVATAPDIASAPWHRVVGADATIKAGPQRSEQVMRLRSEGFEIDGYRLVDFAERFFDLAGPD